MFQKLGAPPISTTPVANLSPVSTKPAANLPPVSTTPVANLLPVSTTPAINFAAGTAGVVDTGVYSGHRNFSKVSSQCAKFVYTARRK